MQHIVGNVGGCIFNTWMFDGFYVILATGYYFSSFRNVVKIEISLNQT